VDIDLALSAHANSRALYDAKKKATEKAARTVEGKPCDEGNESLVVLVDMLIGGP